MKIENWRRHLKQMKTGYYEIDGKIGQLIRYRFIGTSHVKFDFNTRSYEFSCDETPIKLATWRPINEDGKVSYDHIAAEAQLQATQPEVPTVEAEEIPHDYEANSLPATNASNAPTNIDLNQDSLGDLMQTQYEAVMKSMVDAANFANQKLQETIMRLKGEGGDKFVGQAKQIINATNATSKNRDSIIEFFKTGISLMKEQQKSKQNPKNDAQTGNDRQEN